MADIQKCAEFVAELQQVLSMPAGQHHNYVDLSTVKKIEREMLFKPNDLPDNDPVELAFEMLLVEVQNEHLDKVMLGLNELFKSYLRNISTANESTITHEYCKRIMYLFRRSLNTFCYSEEVWTYLGNCFKPLSLYLLDRKLIKACETFWDYASRMGKQAAKHGLHTDRLQRSLRVFEVEAEEQQQNELASLVRSLRHNLEN